MRVLDLATAGAIGGVSLLLLLGLSPQPYLNSAKQSAVEASSRDGLSAFIVGHGLSWLQSAPLRTICSATEAQSGPSIHLSAEVNGVSCSRPPGRGSVVSYNLTLPGREVVLWAWSNGGG